MHEDDSVLWSDIPNNRMLRWSERDGMSVWRDERRVHQRPRARSRRLAAALLARPARGVSHARPTAAIERIVVDRWQGKRFNSPNDIVVKSDGTIWFTDPPYGLIVPEEGHGGTSEIGDCCVFRFDPASGALDPVTDLPEHPNGLAFSPDESLLYVSDTSGALPGQGRNHCLWVFDVVDGRRSPTAACSPRSRRACPTASGSTAQGFVYTSSQDSVQVLHPDGTLLGKIACRRRWATSRSAAPDRDVLYIAASTSLYRIRLATRGVQRP